MPWQTDLLQSPESAQEPAVETRWLARCRDAVRALVPAPGSRDLEAPTKSAPPEPLHLVGGRHGVLLFHGLSSTPLELRYVARGLQRAGYTVRLPVIEGFSHATRALTPRGHRAWVESALHEFDAMRSACDTVAVGGLCMGALLSLRVAAERARQVASILSMSTTLHFDGWATPWTRRLLGLAHWLPGAGRLTVREREPFGLKNERLRAQIAARMRESGGSIAGAASLRVQDLIEARDLMRQVRRDLSRIVAPLLLIHARSDDTASPRSAFEVASGVSSKKVRCVVLSDSYHMISIDNEKVEVLAESREFLDSAYRAKTTAGLVRQQ